MCKPGVELGILRIFQRQSLRPLNYFINTGVITSWNSGFLSELHQGQSRQWGVLGRPQNASAASCQRGPHLKVIFAVNYLLRRMSLTRQCFCFNLNLEFSPILRVLLRIASFQQITHRVAKYEFYSKKRRNQFVLQRRGGEH